MKGLHVLGLIAGVAFLTAVPVSIEWSVGSVGPNLMVSQAEAQTAGMERRQTRREGRREGRQMRREGRRDAREMRREGRQSARDARRAARRGVLPQ